MTAPLSARRHALPARRPAVTRKVVLTTATGEHRFFVSVGFCPQTLRPLEVFYADGQKTGTQMQHSIQDSCVLISLLLQHGAALDAIAHSLGRIPVNGQDTPASAVGAIIAVMQDECGAAA